MFPTRFKPWQIRIFIQSNVRLIGQLSLVTLETTHDSSKRDKG